MHKKYIEEMYDTLTTVNHAKLIEKLEEILLGLEGERTFKWNEDDYYFWSHKLEKLSLRLVTKTQIERHCCALKPGEKPVGQVYFCSPIRKTCDIYVLESQCLHKSELPDYLVKKTNDQY